MCTSVMTSGWLLPVGQLFSDIMLWQHSGHLLFHRRSKLSWEKALLNKQLSIACAFIMIWQILLSQMLALADNKLPTEDERSFNLSTCSILPFDTALWGLFTSGARYCSIDSYIRQLLSTSEFKQTSNIYFSSRSASKFNDYSHLDIVCWWKLNASNLLRLVCVSERNKRVTYVSILYG